MLLALVTIVPALAFIAYNQIDERSRARAQAVEDAISLARVTAARQASVLDGVQRLLLTLSHVPALRQDPASCQALLADVLRDHPGYVNIWLTSAEGRSVCQAVPVAAGLISEHRTWFERVLRTRAVAVSDYQLSVSTGKPDIVVAQPLFSGQGRVEYMLAAGVGVTELDDVVRDIGMPPGWSMTIADRNGIIVARYPHDASAIGRRLPASLSLTQATRAPRDRLISGADTDGRTRLFALVPIQASMDSGMYVAMEVDPATIFVKANEELRKNLLLLLVAAVVALGGGLFAARVFVLRPLHALTNVTSRIASGDFTGRTQLAHGAPGLVDLGAAIDQMALALETRERIRADVDERLQASERRYRLLFEANPHPMWVYDSETLRFLEVNDAALRAYGYTRDEFLAMRITDVRPHEEVQAVVTSAARVRSSPHYTHTGQWHHRRKSGEVFKVEITSHAITFNERAARLVLAQDITRRVEAERGIREAEARMRFALDAARVGIWEARIGDRSAYWSDICEAMHGLAPGTFGGTIAHVMERIHPDDRQQVSDRFQEALRGGRTIDNQYRTVPIDGVERRIAVKGHFFLDEHGAPVRVAGVAIDLTEQSQLEEQLRQAQKMDAIGQLAGGIAHDFNNVLTAILGNADIYLDEAPEDDPHRRTIEDIRTAGRAAANLTRQLLAFSRRQMLAPRVMRLGDSVSEVTPILRRLLGASITLNTVLNDTTNVKADAGQIQQVLVNLAVNARDAMPQGGSLTIRTADVVLDAAFARQHPDVPPGPYVQISVSDTGHGMDAATQKRLFEPFFTTKPKGRGTGLGLATVHGIVRQSGGHVTVESDVGVGTTFTVYLPTTPDAAVQLTPASARPTVLTGTETILLVEDEPGVRDFTYRVLTRYGYRVYAMADPAHALEFATTYPDRLDAIVADMVLPGTNGQVMVERLRGIHPAARVLYISGYSEIASITGGPLAPGTAFLKKPFTAEALGQRVREILDAQIA